MLQWSPEQFIKFQTAGIQTLAGLTGKGFEGFEKLLELNLQTTKTALAEAQECTRKALSAKDPKEFVEMQMEAFQPAAERALAYRRQLFEIVAATRAEYEKVAEVQYTEGKQRLQDFLESMVNNTQAAGPAAPLAAWQEAINATTTFYESMQTTAKQAAQVAESSFNTAAEAASQGVRRRTAQASQTAAQ